RCLTDAADRAFPQAETEGGIAERALLGGAVAGNDAAERWQVLTGGRHCQAGRCEVARIVSGQEHVDGGPMIGQTLRLDAQRTDQGEMLRLASEQRQYLAELNSRNAGRNRFELAA